jgi:hypothetical protein
MALEKCQKKFGTSAVDLSTWRTGLKKLRVKQRRLWSWDMRMCWWGIHRYPKWLEDLRGRAPCGQTLLSQPPVAQNICKNLSYPTLQVKFSHIWSLVEGLWTLDLHLFKLSMYWNPELHWHSCCLWHDDWWRGSRSDPQRASHSVWFFASEETQRLARKLWVLSGHVEGDRFLIMAFFSW